MVNVRKELSNIAFQDPARPSIVLGNDACEIPEPIHSLVRSFVDSARIRVVDKLFIKIWIEFVM